MDKKEESELESALNVVLKFTGRKEFGKLPGLIAKALYFAAARDLLRIQNESTTAGELERAIDMTDALVDELDCVFQNEQQRALNRTCAAAREYLKLLRQGVVKQEGERQGVCESCFENRTLELHEPTGSPSGWLCAECIKDIEKQQGAEGRSDMESSR